MIIYPSKINQNDVIGITATSDGMAHAMYPKRLDNAIKNMKDLGYNIKETNNERTRNKLFSSDAKTRAKEFMDLWQDKSVNCIAQVHGGEFLMEILPYIDGNVIKNSKPKWVFGYSDSSLLNYFLTTNFNISTLTCDNFVSFGMDPGVVFFRGVNLCLL